MRAAVDCRPCDTSFTFEARRYLGKCHRVHHFARPRHTPCGDRCCRSGQYKIGHFRITRPTTIATWNVVRYRINSGDRPPRKLRNTQRRVQDPASRARNFLNALFYKTGRVPWRLPRPEDQLKTSFIIIGFYCDLSGQRLLTSTAKMFDERGRGLILRGGRCTDKGDLYPYLDHADACDLVRPLSMTPAYR